VGAKDGGGYTALLGAAKEGHMACVELLVQNGADVNCQTNDGGTVLLCCANWGRLTIAQHLLEHKADVHYRISKEGGMKNNMDALHYAMRHHQDNDMWYRTPGLVFAFLSCNTDAKNVKIGRSVTAVIRDIHVEEYQHVQARIDEHHRILNLVLSEHVPVDPRFGLGQMGIYQEPLERTLEYLGLSMCKDQVVNTSIDGEAVKRALIPGHLLNANHWFDKCLPP
jgi:hypothetical protein